MRAIRMFPSVADSFKLKKHDGRAEAALIALGAWLAVLMTFVCGRI